MSLCFRVVVSIVFLLLTMTSQTRAQQIKIGWLEKVTINNSNRSFLAKIDTGADNSSIDATDVKLYTKGNGQWVKFSLQNEAGHEFMIDEPVIKKTRIKEKNGSFQRRFVIELEICLGAVNKKVPVNIVDRSNFKYKALIGRSFLTPNFLIDTSQTYLTQPDCKK